MLWWLVAILLALWHFGALLKVAGGLIHLLLVVALLILVWRLLTGRRPI